MVALMFFQPPVEGSETLAVTTILPLFLAIRTPEPLIVPAEAGSMLHVILYLPEGAPVLILSVLALNILTELGTTIL